MFLYVWSIADTWTHSPEVNVCSCMCGLTAAGGTLFSWGLNEWRLGRRGGDNSIPEAGLLHLNVRGFAWRTTEG